MHTALDWIYFSNAVDNNEDPNGSGLLFSLTHLPTWIEGVGDTFFCLNILLADCLFVSHIFSADIRVLYTFSFPGKHHLDMAMLDNMGA